MAAMLRGLACCQEPEVDLTNEIKDIKFKLDYLIKDVEEIKKIVEK